MSRITPVIIEFPTAQAHALYGQCSAVFTGVQRCGTGNSGFTISGSCSVRRMELQSITLDNNGMNLGVWSKNSCGFTFVVFEEPSKPFATLNRASMLCVLADSRKEQGIPFPLMISHSIQFSGNASMPSPSLCNWAGIPPSWPYSSEAQKFGKVDAEQLPQLCWNPHQKCAFPI